MTINEKLSKITLLAMDIDGTLTDGGLTFHNGLQLKEFNVYDGLGIRLSLTNNLYIAWVTGNISETVNDRARSLGVNEVCQGVQNKSEAIKELANRHGFSLDEIAYIGDDLNDYPAFGTAGFGFAVNNAVDEIKRVADLVTEKSGGHGAVREAIETIFKAKGTWEEVVKSYIEMLESDKAASDSGNVA